MPKHSPSDDGPTRGRPRDDRADRLVLDAALDLLRERGPSAVNVASVAARSGVARTTVYRRFRDREALLTAALEVVTRRGTPARDATVTQRLEWLVTRTEEVLAAGIGMGGIAAVLAGTDADFSAALRRALDRGLEPVLEEVAADMAAGRLAGGDPEVVLDLVVGSLLARSLRHGSAGGREWRSRTLAVLTDLLVPPHGDDARGQADDAKL